MYMQRAYVYLHCLKIEISYKSGQSSRGALVLWLPLVWLKRECPGISLEARGVRLVGRGWLKDAPDAVYGVV
jgi:hypothetical protein